MLYSPVQFILQKPTMQLMQFELSPSSSTVLMHQYYTILLVCYTINDLYMDFTWIYHYTFSCLRKSIYWQTEWNRDSWLSIVVLVRSKNPRQGPRPINVGNLVRFSDDKTSWWLIEIFKLLWPSDIWILYIFHKSI